MIDTCRDMETYPHESRNMGNYGLTGISMMSVLPGGGRKPNMATTTDRITSDFLPEGFR